MSGARIEVLRFEGAPVDIGCDLAMARLRDPARAALAGLRQAQGATALDLESVTYGMLAAVCAIAGEFLPKDRITALLQDLERIHRELQQASDFGPQATEVPR